LLRVLGVGELLITNDPEDTLITFALGSCVALTIYSSSQKVLGMAHIALPDSTIDPLKSLQSPGYFADTAVPGMVEKFLKQYHCHGWELNIRLFGGATAVWNDDSFQIGVRNLEAVTAILQNYRLACETSQTGGRFSRTIAVSVKDGKVKVHQQPLNSAQPIEGSPPGKLAILPN
jgi:chemotaxis protein CheD